MTIDVGPDGLRRGLTARPLPVGAPSIAALVDAMPETDAAALIDRDGTLTYAGLARRVRAMVRQLAGYGVGTGSFVAGCAPNGCAIVVAFLAVQRLGGVWIGINPALSPTEKGVLLRDSPIGLVLAGGTVIGELAPICAALEGTPPCVSLDEEYARAGQVSADVTPLDLPLPDTLAPAAIGYTSGTTGTPKGVVHCQQALLVYPNATASGVAGQYVGAGRYGVSISVAILNLMVHAPLLALACGGTCVLMDRADAAGVGQWIQDAQVECFNGAPTTFWDLLNKPDLQHLDLGSLKAVGLGGGPASVPLFEAFRRRFGFDLVGLYGLSEGAATNMLSSCDPATGVVAFRTVYPSVEAVVIGADGEELADGDEGELCIGPRRDSPWTDAFTGMLGYWRKPEETRDAFHGRHLRTGDQAVRDADGGLRIVGRRKELILRGGANIYPLEVETAIRGNPAVDDVVVVGLPDNRLGEIVGAFLKLSPGAAADGGLVAGLQERCRERLARYKVPERWFVVENFPRNALNKPLRTEIRTMTAREIV